MATVFKEVSSKTNFPALEEEVLRFWQQHDVFRRSIEQRENAPTFSFYEGPPTANGRPHIGHVLTRVFKDLFPRYKTMRGYRVERKAGWDTHGLPVEIEVEKELGFSGKQSIEAYGVAAFNEKCKESVFRYVSEWNRLTERIGFWLDTDNPYVTLHNSYVESVWWILRQMWDKDWLYQDYKVVPYCARCGTSLSSHEVSLGYADVEDTSIYVKFELVEPLQVAGVAPDGPTQVLVWTTTPWTLPGNVALAVHPDLEYALVETPATAQGGPAQRVVLAKALLDRALGGDYKILADVAARDLVGKHYKPLFDFAKPEKDAYYIIAGEFVTSEDGSGVVHMAPAYGEDDMQMSRRYNLPVLEMVDLRGRFVPEVTPWQGQWVKEADPAIIQDLESRGILYKSARITHTYPLCWRCDTPLLYYAKTSWFMKRTAVRERLIKNNEKINWYPEHIKHGRFGDFLDGIIDWALSRERYWGTPLPIWICETCGERHCVGSAAELRERALGEVAEDLDLHRPHVDDILLRCEKCGGQMRRVPEVIDAWFDSGSMPVAQYHYPFENQEKFKEQFPADFICEAIDQTRGWFLSLHVIASALFDEVAYKNVICLEHVLDAKGEKMSKHKGNVTDPWSVLDAQGADALRWYFLTSSPPGTPRRFSPDLVDEALRKFILTLWNTYSFFTTYANLDKWQPPAEGSAVAPLRDQLSELDRWVLSELNVLVGEVTKDLDAFDPTGAGRAIETFVDMLSNWFVRRSRRRFWKSESDADKAAAYATLYECLLTLSRLLAPFTPFLAEEMYQNLVRSAHPEATLSVHLTDFPQVDQSMVNEELMRHVRLLMRLVGLGRAARSKAQIKVRQPLAEVLFKLENAAQQTALTGLLGQVAEEINVKRVGFVADAGEVVTYAVKPRFNLLGPRFGKDMRDVAAAIQGLNAVDVLRAQRAGVPLQVEQWSVLPEEIEVARSEKAGFAVVEDGEYLAALNTEITPDLQDEGLARELVRLVQTMRKAAGFNIEDHIITYYQGDETVQRVLGKHAEYVRQETLSDFLRAEPPAEQSHVAQHKADGHPVTLGVARI
ncbi:MAG: isoleucine--tRNA ligase [Chloroflexota bacterium]